MFPREFLCDLRGPSVLNQCLIVVACDEHARAKLNNQTTNRQEQRGYHFNLLSPMGAWKHGGAAIHKL
jgi:hypothetical protein